MTQVVGSSGDAAVVIPAAGAGVRLGSGGPKALCRLRGEPLLLHAVRRVAAAPSVGQVVVAAPPDQVDTCRRLVGPRATVVPGGAQRQQSVAAAMAAVRPDFDLVLVHDVARTLAPTALIEQVAAAVRGGLPAVIPVLPVVDTIARVAVAGEVAGPVDRAALRAVQTPQGFRRAVLARAHAAATDTTATDDAGLVARLGITVHTVPGSPLAIKITTPYDLVVAEALFDQAN